MHLQLRGLGARWVVGRSVRVALDDAQLDNHGAHAVYPVVLQVEMMRDDEM